MKIKNSILLLIVLLSFACSKDEEPAPNAEEETIGELNLEITVPESGGAIFNAEYDGNNIETAGFHYSYNENFQVGNAEHISANPGSNFSSTINTGLIYNQKYFVRAYVESTSGKRIESEEKSFVSLGSIAPVITSVNNSHLQDTVSIKGKNFGNSGYNSVKVYFAETRANIIRSNDTLVECIVPVEFQNPDPEVRLKIYEKEVVYNEFKLFTPEVSSASQTDFALGDTITLYGDHFDTAVERTKVLSDNMELEVLFTSRDSLQFVLPLDASTSNIEVTLRAQLQEIKVDFIGQYKRPEILNIEGNIRTYDTLIFKGTNFSPLKEANKIYFDGHQAKILSASQTELKIQTPIGPYEDSTPEVTYNLMDYTIKPGEELEFQDPWLFKAQTEFEFYGNTDQNFSQDGKLYLVQKNYGEYNLSFLEFDPESLEFNKFQMSLPETHLADYPFQVIQDPATGKVYLLFNAEEKNFYELKMESGSITGLEDYPAITSNYPEAFISNNNIFVTGGWVDNYSRTDTTADELNELWAYDISNKEWIQKTGHPTSYSRSGDVIFQKGNDSYISYGINTTGGVSLWKYSSSSDSWSNQNSHYSAKFGKAFFMHKGKGYAYFADPVNATPSNFAYKYDLEANAWESIKPLNNRYFTYFSFPDRHAAFKVDGRVFIGIYQYPQLKFFEADLDKI